MPVKQPARMYQMRCEFIAQSSVGAIKTDINQDKLLEDIKKSVTYLGLHRSLEKYFVGMVEIAYLNPEMNLAEYYQIALEKCSIDPSITEIQNQYQ